MAKSEIEEILNKINECEVVIPGDLANKLLYNRASIMRSIKTESGAWWIHIYPREKGVLTNKVVIVGEHHQVETTKELMYQIGE